MTSASASVYPTCNHIVLTAVSVSIGVVLPHFQPQCQLASPSRTSAHVHALVQFRSRSRPRTIRLTFTPSYNSAHVHALVQFGSRPRPRTICLASVSCQSRYLLDLALASAHCVSDSAFNLHCLCTHALLVLVRTYCRNSVFRFGATFSPYVGTNQRH